MVKYTKIAALCTSVFCMAESHAANLLLNGSFEDFSSPQYGQGVMADHWQVVNVTPDTYGTYGITPSSGYYSSNFGGIGAYDGTQWVAGWSSADEQFGQSLSGQLVAGEEYSLSAYMHTAFRSDLKGPGGYEVYLTSTLSAVNGSAGELLIGTLGATTDFNNGWEFFEFGFSAPADVSSYNAIVFKSYGVNGVGSYAGLDSVMLTSAVPVPATAWLFGSALMGLAGIKRKK